MAVGPDSASILLQSLGETMSAFRDLFSAVGLVTVGLVGCKIIWNVGKLTWVHFGVTASRQRKRLRQLGSWAIIFGCCDEVDFEIVKLLASSGLSIIFISPIDEKEAVEISSRELEIKYNISCVRICLSIETVYDLSLWEDVVEAVQNKDIAIMVVSVDSKSHILTHITDNALLAETSCVDLSHIYRKQHFNTFLATNLSMELFRRKHTQNLVDEISNISDSNNIAVQLLTPLDLYCKKGEVSRQSPSHVSWWWWLSLSKPNWFCPPADILAYRIFLTLGRCRWTTGYFPYTMIFYTNDFLRLPMTKVASSIINRPSLAASDPASLESLRKASIARHGKIFVSFAVTIVAGSILFYLARQDLSNQKYDRMKIRQKIQREISEKRENEILKTTLKDSSVSSVSK
uniref:Uncharacterized protein n=1 Tax=Romanomermis culicivorax TaxID=13658 RepID=A0A915JJ27_ROMCU